MAFSTGVPVRAIRWVAVIFLRALAAWVSGFLMSDASSMTRVWSSVLE